MMNRLKSRMLLCAVLGMLAACLATGAQAQTTFSITRTFSSGYVTGNTLNVAVQFDLSSTSTIVGLGLTETLPTGWTFNSIVGSTPAPTVFPGAGESGNLEFAWSSLPSGYPFVFTYKVNVPAGQSGTKSLVGTAEATLGTNPVQFATASRTSLIGATGAMRFSAPVGAEAWPAGTPHDIKWLSTAAAGNQVKLKLLKNGQTLYWIGGLLANSSSAENRFQNWYPLTSLAPGVDYSILVYKPDYTFTGRSINFAITAPPLKLTSPSTSGKLVPGAPVTITWDSTLTAGSQVKFKLDRALTPGFSTLYSPTIPAVNKTYTWTVPASVPLGTDYILSLYEQSYLNLSTSPALGVVNLLVTNPVGGESWAGGSVKTITWKASAAVGGSSVKMKARLVKGPSSTVIKVLTGLVDNTGSTNVTLPTVGTGAGQIVAGNDYRIVVYREDFAFLAGSNAFSIVP